MNNEMQHTNARLIYEVYLPPPNILHFNYSIRQRETPPPPHTFVEVVINDQICLDNLSIEEQQVLKISLFTDRIPVSHNAISNIKFITSILNYEWNYNNLPAMEEMFYLSTVLRIIDKNEKLFPVTNKLENMLRETLSGLTSPTNWCIDLLYNEKLLDLCNDVGLFNKNNLGCCFDLGIFTPNHVRKGLFLSSDKKYDRLCLYIKSVMITI
jgi:hypothetical protein